MTDPPSGNKQLALDLPPVEASGADDFIRGGANARAFDFVHAWPDWPAPVVVLAGPEGSGKSHLARIWAGRAGADVVGGDGQTLDGLVHTPGPRVVIEDVDASSVDETAMFHLFNHVVESDGALMMTARTPPAAWQVGLADLASRLRATTLVEIEQPDDALIEAVLVKLLADRQIEISEAVAKYALNRMERSLGAARDLAGRIDRRSLEEGRRVTTRLVARVLGDAEDG